MKGFHVSRTLVILVIVLAETAAFAPSGSISLDGGELPEIPGSLIPWIIGGASGGAIWLRSFFRKK